jgi:2-polyprenyl-6-methoxyphenol hydroxylase-like FAD-dependent oxidoreductase
LKLPPPVSVDLMVWRGVVEIGPDSKLDFVREWPIGKFVPFGERMQVTYFNLSTKIPNTIAWVFTCRNDTGHPIQCGVTTPWDMISIYRAQLSKEQQELDHDKFQTAKDLFRETHDPTDLTWSTELAVVDLEANGWGLQGRVVLVGDAAHAIRPASGLGGSLAFEDATCLSRMLFAHEREHDADPNKSNEYPSIPDRLQQFAALRLPRCQSISRDQTLRSEWSYKLGFIGVPAWDDAYRDWVMLGPDAPPDPPVDERDVFASLQGA